MTKNPAVPDESAKTQEGEVAPLAETKRDPNRQKESPSFEDLRKFLRSSPYEGMAKSLESKGFSVKEALLEINDLIIAELEKNPENSADLERFRESIERLYREETEKEEKINPDVIGRAERDVALAEEIERMEEGEDFDHPLAMAGILERQQWGRILTGLQKGDKVLSFLVPGADFLSIKNLNDAILGPQITNKVIAQKRKVVEREMRKIDKNAAMFQSDYKIEIVKISQDSNVNSSQLEAASRAIDAEMTDFVGKIVDDLIQQEKEVMRKEENQKTIKISEEKIQKLDNFKKELGGELGGKSGFKMNYGLSEVEGNSMEDKILSLDYSLGTSRMARQNEEGDGGEYMYGAEYNEESLETELDSIKDLRYKIISGQGHGNTITDKEGNEFSIFNKKGDKFFLNPDVLRDVRKGKFKTDNKQALDDIIFYVKKLNILDVVKPFTMEEISKVEEDVETARSLADKLKKGEELSESEAKTVAEMLRSEEKDRAYTSKSEFHKRAVAMKECAYISLDVLDLGIDQILECEDILQDVDKKSGKKRMAEFNKLALSAGDKTTEKLRDFRKKVAEVYKEFGFDDDLITGEVGGDELTLAVDTSDMSEEKLDEFLFALKDKTNTRVIKTVVSKADKNASSENDPQKLVEMHLRALKRAEEGVAIAKDIEEAERKLNRLFKKQGENAAKEKMAALRGLFVLEDGQVKSNVVVTEKEGVFKVGKFKVASETKDDNYESSVYEFDYETIRGELDNILGKETEVK